MAKMGVRGLALPFVKKAAIQKLGANKTLKMLREQGLGYRRTTFLADYRTYAKLPKVSERLKYIPKKYRVSRENYIEPPEPLPKNYGYTIKVKYRKKPTGELIERNYVVVSDNPLSVGQAEQEGALGMERDIESYDIEIVDKRLTAAMHKRGARW